jgi:hypothetical protein
MSYAGCHMLNVICWMSYAECHMLSAVTLNVIKLSVVMVGVMGPLTTGLLAVNLANSNVSK